MFFKDHQMVLNEFVYIVKESTNIIAIRQDMKKHANSKRKTLLQLKQMKYNIKLIMNKKKYSKFLFENK